MKKSNNKLWLIIGAVVVIALIVLIWQSSTQNDLQPGDTLPPEITTAPSNTQIDPDGAFSVLYLDVGQADAALIRCDGHAMLIDGGNREDSALLFTVLTREKVKTLDYVVGTHAHEDHMGGLPAAFRACEVKCAMSPVTYHETATFTNYADAVRDEGLTLTVPKPGDTFTLGSASVTVMGPNKQYEDVNDTSIVLKITYGEVSFLFTGDQGWMPEQDLLDAGFDPSATVLKAGHHGSSDSTAYRFLRQVAPKYAIISCGKNNDYGHPHRELLSRLNDAKVTYFRTDEVGDILCLCNGKDVSFRTGKDARTQEEDTAYNYVGNIANGKLHRITCDALPKAENCVYFHTKEEAIAAGFTEFCGGCRP